MKLKINGESSSFYQNCNSLEKKISRLVLIENIAKTQERNFWEKIMIETHTCIYLKKPLRNWLICIHKSS